MNDRTRVLAAVGLTVLLFLGVQLGALALVEPFDASERQAVDDPENPTNSIVYFAIILVATGIMLAAFKFDLQWLIRLLIIGVSVMLAWFVFTEFLPPVAEIAGVNVPAAVAAIGVGAALLWYPEWYVIDTTGVLMGAGAAALFGISFGLLPALLLLTVLAVYDAISVYGTEHMLDLAEGVMDLKIPVVLVVPTTLSYSYLAAGSTDDVLEDGGRKAADDGDGAAGAENDDRNDAEPADDDELGRDALFIGLGDAVIPTILVASAAFFLDAGTIAVPGIVLNAPALGALLGTIAGLLVLMYMVLKGRPHAGLPLLNGGAIGGYLLGAVASGVSLVTALGL
ncbi:presenilin family intramembrane aspartyl protease PSH [Halosolutus gelatinilyticus]|uniref:presenilin family intramembrane aspartyl protease PSH n=1 Tax=Halosolutus gelatinilyticus TaxID=2931975 RepID=UPI001FF1FBE2|nr:presenilin family intramembrane aspartyl protease PSH [Halosolutus gelatinilyticus]